MDPSKKKIWDYMADEDKQRYKQEMLLYDQRVRELEADETATIKPPPKKPMSAFFEFARTRRRLLQREHPKEANASISKMLSDEWHALSSAERDKFTSIYKRKHKEYMEAMKPFRQKRPSKSKRRKTPNNLLPNMRNIVGLPSFQSITQIPSMPPGLGFVVGSPQASIAFSNLSFQSLSANLIGSLTPMQQANLATLMMNPIMNSTSALNYNPVIPHHLGASFGTNAAQHNAPAPVSSSTPSRSQDTEELQELEAMTYPADAPAVSESIFDDSPEHSES